MKERTKRTKSIATCIHSVKELVMKSIWRKWLDFFANEVAFLKLHALLKSNTSNFSRKTSINLFHSINSNGIMFNFKSCPSWSSICTFVKIALKTEIQIWAQVKLIKLFDKLQFITKRVFRDLFYLKRNQGYLFLAGIFEQVSDLKIS